MGESGIMRPTRQEFVKFLIFIMALFSFHGANAQTPRAKLDPSFGMPEFICQFVIPNDGKSEIDRFTIIPNADDSSQSDLAIMVLTALNPDPSDPIGSAPGVSLGHLTFNAKSNEETFTAVTASSKISMTLLHKVQLTMSYLGEGGKWKSVTTAGKCDPIQQESVDAHN